MRTNIILRGHSNHQPSISHPIHRTLYCRMIMRWIRCIRCNLITILQSPFPLTIYNRRNISNTLIIPTRNRIKQPHRTKQKLRQNSIPPLFLNQRHNRIPNHNLIISHLMLTNTISFRRPRKLPTRQSIINSSTHQTRMIFPICLCHLTINPKQNWRRSSPSYISINPNNSTLHTQHKNTIHINIPNQQNIILNNNLIILTTILNRSTPSRRTLHHDWTNLISDLLLILFN